MNIYNAMLLITLIIPGILMPMEKSVLGKRPLEEDSNEQTTKSPRLDPEVSDMMPEEDITQEIISLPTPLITAFNPQTPTSAAQSDLEIEKDITQTPLSLEQDQTTSVIDPLELEWFVTREELLNNFNSYPMKPNSIETWDDQDTIIPLSTPALNQQIPVSTPQESATTGEKQFKCNHAGCNYAAARKDYLTTHKRTHTGEKPFICDYNGCNYAAAQSSALTAHKRTHTGEKPFICDYEGCNFAVAQKSTLTKHKRTHTGEKPFKCDYTGCDYAAAQSNALTAHMKTHTGEKPFKCDYDGCNYAAAQQITLTNHIRIHADKKPYKCDYKDCNKAFAHLGTLDNHKKIHAGKKHSHDHESW